MKDILRHLFEYKSFSRKEAYDILTNIAVGKYDTHQIAAFMTTYGMRSIRVEELGGFRDAMYDLCLKVDFKGYDLIDLCGTGGDGKNMPVTGLVKRSLLPINDIGCWQLWIIAVISTIEVWLGHITIGFDQSISSSKSTLKRKPTKDAAESVIHFRMPAMVR